MARVRTFLNQLKIFLFNAAGDMPTAAVFGKGVAQVDHILHVSDGSTYSTRLTGMFYTGAGTPEGAVAAAVGSVYTRTDGGANTTLYVKESGAGNTGWVAK